jgi:hypothetical protein
MTSSASRVAKPLLERAFFKTYGIKLADVFSSLDLSIGSYRHSISTIIPQMTRVTLINKKDASQGRPQPCQEEVPLQPEAL